MENDRARPQTRWGINAGREFLDVAVAEPAKDAVPISAYRYAPDDDADRADHLDRCDRVAELN